MKKLLLMLGAVLSSNILASTELTSISRHQYNTLGWLEKVETTPNGFKRYEYDGYERVLKEYYADDTLKQEYRYDSSFNRKKWDITPRGSWTHYSYDNFDRVTTVTDEMNRDFVTSYTGLGKVLTEDNPVTGLVTFKYNDAHNLEEKLISSTSNKITYNYDGYGREMGLWDYNITVENSKGYHLSGNGIGQVSQSVDINNDIYTTYAYKYDSFQRSISEVSTTIDFIDYAPTRKTYYEYTPAGLVKKITYPSGMVVEYSYGGTDRVQSVSINGSSIITNVKWNSVGNLLSYNYPGGTYSVQYHPTGQIKSIDSNRIKLRYTYYPDGQLQTKEDLNYSTSNKHYTYNEDKQILDETNNFNLSSEWKESFATEYKLGNRSGNGYVNDSIGKLYSLDGDIVQYDSRGNTSKDHRGWNRSFDALNRSIYASNSSTNKVYYGKDHNSNRTYKKVNSKTHRYYYSTTGSLLTSYNDSSLDTDYIYLGKLLVAIRQNNSNYYVHLDRSARPEVVTNSSGVIVQRNNNSAFKHEVVSSSLPTQLNIGYPGQYYDSETGTYENGARTYDPKTGRFLQSDPLGLVDGPNTYQYALGNPNKFIDPSGLATESYLNRPLGLSVEQYQSIVATASEEALIEAATSVALPLKIGHKAYQGYRIVTNSGTRWKNGWRTADGKFASPNGPGTPGAAAEQAVWDAVKQKPGWNVIEGRVSVRNANGQLRVYDGAAVSPRGRVIGLEVKSGSATKTAAQRNFDSGVNTSNPAVGVGQSGGINVGRSLEIRVP